MGLFKGLYEKLKGSLLLGILVAGTLFGWIYNLLTSKRQLQEKIGELETKEKIKETLIKVEGAKNDFEEAINNYNDLVKRTGSKSGGDDRNTPGV